MPTLLDLLRWHQTEVERERQNRPEMRGRPFSRLFSPAKLPRRSSSECEMEGVAKLRESGDSQPDAGVSSHGMKQSSGGGSGLAPGWPVGLMSPPRGGFSAENSNSSWADMELDVIGHFKVSPLTNQVTLASYWWRQNTFQYHGDQMQL